jgi:hypothetical protein
MLRKRVLKRGLVAAASVLALVATVTPTRASAPPKVDWFAVAGMRVDDVALDGAGGAVIVGQYKGFGMALTKALPVATSLDVKRP